MIISKKKAWAIARDDQVRKHSREALVSLSRAALSARRASQSKKSTKTKKILVGTGLLVASAALLFALAQKNSRKAF